MGFLPGLKVSYPRCAQACSHVCHSLASLRPPCTHKGTHRTPNVHTHKVTPTHTLGGKHLPPPMHAYTHIPHLALCTHSHTLSSSPSTYPVPSHRLAFHLKNQATSTVSREFLLEIGFSLKGPNSHSDLGTGMCTKLFSLILNAQI